ncbi:MAG: hypothetical protein ACJ8FY_24230 [Gemmataceae bacterium]
MPRAVVKYGLIYPLEPLPLEWTNGKEVWVDALNHENGKDHEDSPEAIDKWYEELNAMVDLNDPADMQRLEDALKEADRIEMERWPPFRST